MVNSGIGIVGLFRIASGLFVEAFCKNCGYGSNNLAELLAVHQGLSLAISRGYSSLVVETDSHLLFNELCRGTKNLHRIALVKDCQHYFNFFQKLQMRFTYSEENQAIDMLSKYACNLETLHHTLFSSSPSFLQAVLRHDQKMVGVKGIGHSRLLNMVVDIKWSVISVKHVVCMRSVL